MQVSYPIREQDELLVQGYEKTRNNCLVLVSVNAQQSWDIICTYQLVITRQAE